METGLFEVDDNFARDSGVSIEDAFVKPNNDYYINLIVQVVVVTWA